MLLEAASQVLYIKWAPIGFIGLLPADEYEANAGRVVSMLVSGASREELTKYLASEAAALSGRPVDVAAMQPVTEELMKLKELRVAL